MNEGTIYLRNLKRGERDAFSAACRRRGKNMSTVLRDFIRKYVKDDGKLNLKRKR